MVKIAKMYFDECTVNDTGFIFTTFRTNGSESHCFVQFNFFFRFFYGKMKHIQPDLLTVREVTGNLCNSGARGEI